MPSHASKQMWDIFKGTETFVYQYDLESKQLSSVGLFPGESPPVKFKRLRITSEQMIAVFFTKSSHGASVLLRERKKANAEWYINICRPLVFEAWSARCPNDRACGFVLHHNNAGVHTTAASLDYLEANCIQLVTQIPYTPGFAAWDFFLFPQVKQQLMGKQFQGVEYA